MTWFGTLIKHNNTYTYIQTSKQQHTQGVVRLQILVGQFEETLDSLQRHFGLQDAVEHPGECVEWDDQHTNQSQRGEHLQGRTWTTELHRVIKQQQTTGCKNPSLHSSITSLESRRSFCKTWFLLLIMELWTKLELCQIWWSRHGRLTVKVLIPTKHQRICDLTKMKRHDWSYKMYRTRGMHLC